MDFLIGLSQGMTQGLLGRQRDESRQFEKQQDLLLDQLHRDAAKVRQEDYPKMLDYIHRVTVAKNPKQLSEAFGEYKLAAIAEDYQREEQDRQFNDAIPVQQKAPDIQLEGASAGSLPGGIKVMGGPGIQLEGQSDAIPTEIRQAQMRDPNAYAQGKIRFASQEGAQGRQIELLRAKGEIQTEGYIAREEARGKARMAEITEKAKTAGLKGIKYGYDQEGNLVGMGMDAKGEPVTQNFGKVQLPQSIIAQANIESREQLQQDRLKQDQQQFSLRIKDAQARTAILRTEAAARIKESNERIKSGYYGTSRNNYAAQNLTKVFEMRDSAIEREITGLQQQANEALQQMAFFPEQMKARYEETMSKLAAKEAERRTLGEQFSGAMEQVGMIGASIKTEEKTSIKTEKSSGGSPRKNTQPTLKVGSIREAMGLGGKK